MATDGQPPNLLQNALLISQITANMTVCSLCLSIPVDNLPDFPSSYYTHSNGWERINDFRLAHRAPMPPGLLGFPHRPDSHSLRTAAASCSLCRLILAQIDLVVDEFRVASQDSFFQQHHTAGYPTFDLFLTRRRDTGHGFLILCHSTVRKTIYLLGAIGLGVLDGKELCFAQSINNVATPARAHVRLV
jgi:hypothetical protein